MSDGQRQVLRVCWADKQPAPRGGVPSDFVTSEKKGGGGSGKTGATTRKGSYIYHTPIFYPLTFGPDRSVLKKQLGIRDNLRFTVYLRFQIILVQSKI